MDPFVLVSLILLIPWRVHGPQPAVRSSYAFKSYINKFQFTMIISSTGYRILFWLLFSRSFSTRFLVINSEMLRSMINKRIKNNLQNRRYDKDESDENRSISVDIFHHTASGNEKKWKCILCNCRVSVETTNIIFAITKWTWKWQILRG